MSTAGDKPQGVNPGASPGVASVIEKLGPIDILINNAGATWGAAMEEHPLEAWQKVVGSSVI